MKNLIIKYGLPNSGNKVKYLNDKNKKIYEIRKKPKFKFDNKNNIGYIKFYNFDFTNDIYYYKDAELLKILVQNKLLLWKEKSNKIIIDLSELNDGTFQPIIESLYEILGNTTLYGKTKKDKILFNEKKWQNLFSGKFKEHLEVFKSSKINNFWKVAIIISEKTNGPGEIIAAIFKGRNNVKLFGSKTKGNLYFSETFKKNNKLINIPVNYFHSINYKIYKDFIIKPDIEKRPNKNVLKLVFRWFK